MLFRRRNRPNISTRLQGLVWPRRGWRRALEYVWHRMSRLSGTPHSIALGFAAGVFASFTPFMGFHFVIGFAIAFALGGSLVASAFGTFFGNPLTFPFIWILTYKLGAFLLGIDGTADVEMDLPATAWWMLFNDPSALWAKFLEELWPVIRPMTVGGVPLGTTVGCFLYFPVKYMVRVYQSRRKQKLAERAELQKRSSNEVNA